MPKPSYSGTISLQEVSVNGAPAAGQGLQITISFTDDAVSPAAVFDSAPGTPFGCKVWENTPAQAADVGEDQGTVTFTATDGTPSVPPCTFDSTAGYVCIGSMGAGGTIAIVSAAMGLYSLTDDTDFTGATGRYLKFPGSVTLSGAYPIVMQPAMGTIIFVSTTPITPGPIPATQPHLTIAGVGPIPGTVDPGFLEDDDEITVALASAGAGDFESFSKVFSTAGGGVGDDFVLSTASQGVISNIPVNGTAFTVGCSGAGGTCNVATGSLLSITTTDAVIAPGTSPFALPPPTTKEVSIRCAMLGVDQITVPADVSAFLMSSGATRIQATFIRANLQQASNTAAAPAIANTNIVAGHGVVGFSNP